MAKSDSEQNAAGAGQTSGNEEQTPPTPPAPPKTDDNENPKPPPAPPAPPKTSGKRKVKAYKCVKACRFKNELYKVGDPLGPITGPEAIPADFFEEV